MTDATFVPRRSARVAKREAENPAPPKVAPAAKKAKTAASKPTAKSVTKNSAGSSSDSKVLEVGDALPNIVLKNQNDEDINVFEVSKSNTLVIFAYPKASTPGCTKKNFQTKQSLPYDLISDTKFELIGPLGAKKTAKGGVTRSHWVIKDGKIAVKALAISPVDSFTKALEYVKAKIEGGDKNNKEEKEEPKEESKEESKDESKEESKEKATEETKEGSKEEPKEDSKDQSKDEAKDEPKDESEESK